MSQVPKEIEYKYLVTNPDIVKQLVDDQAQVLAVIEMEQGYLCESDKLVVRVRLCKSLNDEWGALTLKTTEPGIERTEIERKLSLAEAQALMQTAQSVVKKTRYVVSVSGDHWEVDVFGGELTGLVCAELEVESQDYQFTPPQQWGLVDVSLERLFSNHSLSTMSATDLKSLLEKNLH